MVPVISSRRETLGDLPSSRSTMPTIAHIACLLNLQLAKLTCLGRQSRWFDLWQSQSDKRPVGTQELVGHSKLGCPANCYAPFTLARGVIQEDYGTIA